MFSQAHKLTSSQLTAHKRLELKFHCELLVIVLPIALFSLGCGGRVGLSADNSSNPKSDIRNTPGIFDAGVVFADEASYVCISLDKLGLDDDEEIVSIESSCICVRPSVVCYLKRKSEVRHALRLDFVKESKTQDGIEPV